MIAEAGQLEDRPPCGHPLHRLLAREREAITELFESYSGTTGPTASSRIRPGSR
jgi:hypothetical protein